MTVCVIFGLQRSGTNFTEQLVKNNIQGMRPRPAYVKGGVWKHVYNLPDSPEPDHRVDISIRQQRTKDIGNKIKAAYIHKHPYTWIESIGRKPVDIPKRYPDLVKQGDDGIMIGQINIIEAAKLHAAHGLWWLDFIRNRPTIPKIQYEYLIRSTGSARKVLNELASAWGGKLASSTDLIVPDKVTQSAKFTDKDRSRYTSFQVETLTWDQIKEINKHLKPGVMEEQGYTMIKSAAEFKKAKSVDA